MNDMLYKIGYCYAGLRSALGGRMVHSNKDVIDPVNGLANLYGVCREKNVKISNATQNFILALKKQKNIDFSSSLDWFRGFFAFQKIDGFCVDLNAAVVDSGLTQTEAIEFLEISKNTFSNWTSGVRIPPEYVQENILQKIKINNKKKPRT